MPKRRADDFQDATSPSQFSSVAMQQCAITAERASQIERLAAAERVTPWQYGLEHGDFDLIDADVIKTILNPAAVIEGYEITRLLGRGGMGVVYQARQLSLNRDVALKTILLSQLANATVVKRFEKEAQILASLTHPNIVTAFDFGKRDGRLFLAMELVRGKDVQRMIEHFGHVPEYLTWQVLRQATAGLAQAAAAGVIHRDIKPANLLLVRPPDGFPLPPNVPLLKIADFGLSTLADNQDSAQERITSASVNVGSPVYMAPEQLESREVGAASDIFSLGATAWHMLVGAPPLSGLPLRTIIAKRLGEAMPAVTEYRQGVSTQTAQLLADMLHVDLTARISDYPTLLQRIDQVIQFLDTANNNTHDSLDWMVADPIPSPPPESLLGSSTHASSQLLETRAFGTSSDLPAKKTESSSSRHRKRVWLAIPLLLVLIPAAIWSSLQLSRPAQGVRENEEFGSRITLFDGQTLAGWLPLSGSWSPSTDDEGGRILRGTDGTVAFNYGKLLQATESSYFALETSVDRQSAALAEVEFDFPQPATVQSTAATRTDAQHVLQFSAERVQLAVRRPSQELDVQLAISRPVAYPVLVRCERQGDWWWVFIDGAELGSVRSLHPSLSPRLQLSARDGSARFSDISLVPAAR